MEDNNSLSLLSVNLFKYHFNEFCILSESERKVCVLESHFSIWEIIGQNLICRQACLKVDLVKGYNEV